MTAHTGHVPQHRRTRADRSPLRRGPPGAQLFTAEQAVAFVRRDGRLVLTFLGYSGKGYEDEAAMLAAARAVLGEHNPRAAVVNSGATAAGIGAVYRLARELGFRTTGIVSARALESGAPLSPWVERVAFVDDSTWGGLVEETGRLSPTSQAMVDASDLLIAIGGGSVARDELLAAKRLGKPIRFVPADMNHAAARAAAKKAGRDRPVDFRGAIDESMVAA